MKSLLQATFGWLTRTDENPLLPLTSENLAIKALPREAPENEHGPVTVVAPVVAVSLPVTLPTDSPEENLPVEAVAASPASESSPLAQVAIRVKAGVVYGTCPHCSSIWNLKDRILRHAVRRTEVQPRLTCPSCDHELSLPKSLKLK